MVQVIEGLAGDWRRLDERIECLSVEIEVLARQDGGCGRLMSVPGIGPIISSAMVAAIGAGDAFSKGRDGIVTLTNNRSYRSSTRSRSCL
jgi:transposase